MLECFLLYLVYISVHTRSASHCWRIKGHAGLWQLLIQSGSSELTGEAAREDGEGEICDALWQFFRIVIGDVVLCALRRILLKMISLPLLPGGNLVLHISTLCFLVNVCPSEYYTECNTKVAMVAVLQAHNAHLDTCLCLT